MRRKRQIQGHLELGDTMTGSALSDEQRNRLVRLVAQLLLAVYEADREGDDRDREDHAQPS